MRRVLIVASALAWYACGSEPQTPANHLGEGDRFLAAGDTTGAQAAYRLALGQDSLNADLLTRMGRIYASQGKFQPADIYLRRAADLTYQRGVVAMQEHNPAKAQAAFEHTLAIIPAHPLAFLRLGDLAHDAGEDGQALACFEKAIAANPEYPEGYVKAGKLYLRQRRLPDAQRAFDRCIELNINAVEAYLGLGELYLLQGNPSSAAEQYRKVLLIDPHSPVATAALARLGSHPSPTRGL
jgi:tetratricopeptide (TPR) repeat protein